MSPTTMSSRVRARQTLNEVRVLQALRHEHIVSYRDSFVAPGLAPRERDGKLCIVMEWASGGDLAGSIKARKHSGGRFLESEILRLARQICSALAYCHQEHKLLHRDLKPANIFLDASGDAKIGDFGISRFLAASGSLAQTQCGTPLYMSPEMAAGRSYSRAADAWAVGCILFEMMTLTQPWLGQIEANRAVRAGGVVGLMRHISRDAGGIRTDALSARGYSEGLCALVCALLSRNPAIRPTFASVLEWPLFASPPGAVQRVQPAQIPEHAHADPTGAERHAAAMAIQRSFRRTEQECEDRIPVLNAREPAKLSEGELDLEPTLLIEPTPTPKHSDGAAGRHDRREAVEGAVAPNRAKFRDRGPAFPSRPHEAWQVRAPSAADVACQIGRPKPGRETAAFAPEPEPQPRSRVTPSKKPSYAAATPINHRAQVARGVPLTRPEPPPRSAAAAAADAAKMAVEAAKRARDAAADLRKRRDEQLFRANARNRSSAQDEVTAAQKIIDSFKRSQARRRAVNAGRRPPAVADPPTKHVRVTPNRSRAQPPPRLLHELHRNGKPDRQAPSLANYALGMRPMPPRVAPTRERIGPCLEKAKPVPTIAELKSRFEEANARARRLQRPDEHRPAPNYVAAPSKLDWIAHLEPEEKQRILALIHDARACA